MNSIPPMHTALRAELARIIPTYQDRLVRRAERFVHNRERAEELAQEAQAVALASLDSWRGDGKLSTWLYGIVTNLALNAVRKHGDLLAEDGLLEGIDPATSPLTRFGREERAAFVREVSASALDAQERIAIELRYVENLPVEQITEIMKLDGSGARALLQRARRKLKAAMTERLAARGNGTSFVRSAW